MPAPDSTDLDTAPPEGDRKTLNGGHDPSEMGKRGAQRSAEVRRQKGAERRARAAAGAAVGGVGSGSGGAGSGSSAGSELARRVLEDVLGDRHASPGEKVAAARALLQHATVGVVIDTTSPLEHLSDAELLARIRYLHELAPPGSTGVRR